MKKTMALLSVAFVLGAAYAADSQDTLPVTEGVKEYTRTSYTITEKFGDYYRAPAAKYVHVFDENGREVESTELTAKDAFVDRLTYTYNEEGKLATTACVDSDGTILWKIDTTYGADGNKTDESEYDAAGQLTSKSIFKYAAKQSEEAYYNADGVLLGKTITKYDDTARPVEVAKYGAKGALEEKRLLSYNDAGKLAETAYYGADGAQVRKVVYRFDANYAITEAQTYNSENRLAVRVIYKYEGMGNVAKTTTYVVADKFGTTVNELVDINEYSFKY